MLNLVELMLHSWILNTVDMRKSGYQAQPIEGRSWFWIHEYKNTINQRKIGVDFYEISEY